MRLNRERSIRCRSEAGRRKSAARGLWVGRPLAYFLLCLAAVVPGCLEERTVEVVAGADIFARFNARGLVSALDDSLTVDLVDAADVRKVMDEHGIQHLDDARVGSVSYRVTRPDANAPERTVSGTLSVDGRALATFARADVGDPSLSEWTPLNIWEADSPFNHGIDYIHMRIAEYLRAASGGASNPPRPTVTFRVTGVSLPQDVETDFDWEVRLGLTLVGRRTIEVFDPL